jgi:hypothetical protein
MQSRILFFLIFVSFVASAQINVDPIMTCSAIRKQINLTIYRMGSGMKMLIEPMGARREIVHLQGYLNETSFEFQLFATTADGDIILRPFGKISGSKIGLDFNSKVVTYSSTLDYLCKRVAR